MSKYKLVFNPMTVEFDNVLRSPIQNKKTIILGANVETEVESITFGDFISLKYFLSVESVDQTKQRYYELTVTKDNTDLKDSVGNRVNKGINLDLDPRIDGSNFELIITNNESFDVTLCYTRMTL